MNRLLLTNPRLVRSFGNLASEVENMMDRFFAESPTGQSGNSTADTANTAASHAVAAEMHSFTPRLDAAETEHGFEISIDLPGVKAEDVHVELHEDRLTVSGKRERVVAESGKQFHRVERSSGSFARSMVLPAPVDQDRIEASFDNGVLHVSLPKLAVAQPRRIQIKTANGPVVGSQAEIKADVAQGQPAGDCLENGGCG